MPRVLWTKNDVDPFRNGRRITYNAAGRKAIIKFANMCQRGRMFALRDWNERLVLKAWRLEIFKATAPPFTDSLLARHRFSLLARTPTTHPKSFDNLVCNESRSSPGASRFLRARNSVGTPPARWLRKREYGLNVARGWFYRCYRMATDFSNRPNVKPKPVTLD